MDPSRVHEVIVHISYDTVANFTPDDLIELRDYLEAIVGTEFQIELAHVDVRVRPFGPIDDYDEPLFIRIIAQRSYDISEQERVSDDLKTQITDHFRRPFRLWVEFAPATFTEVTNVKDTQ